MRSIQDAAKLPGEVKYRPPTGKDEDRMLAIFTGRTERADKIAKPQVLPKDVKEAASRYPTT